MFNQILYSIRAAWPIPAAFALLIIALVIQIDEGGINFSLFSAKFTITSLTKIRIILVVAAVVFLMVPALRDYSAVFPTALQARLHYDIKGLRIALDELPKQAKETMQVRLTGWEPEREEILKNWSEELDKYLRGTYSDSDKINAPSFKFDDNTVSVGEVTFQAKNAGGQRYEMVSGNGFLDHTYDSPAGCLIKARTHFLLAADQKPIQIKLVDIYFRWHKVIEPIFKQYMESPDGVAGVRSAPILKPCVSATNLTFFPSLKLGKTVFFVEASDGSKDLIPVVYGQHIPRDFKT
jgi:hypothetical protein